jgi:hypothetical protein
LAIANRFARVQVSFTAKQPLIGDGQWPLRDCFDNAISLKARYEKESRMSPCDAQR